MPSGASTWGASWPRSRPGVAVERCSKVTSPHHSARPSARSAPPARLSGPPWCRAREPVRPTTSSAGSAGRHWRAVDGAPSVTTTPLDPENWSCPVPLRDHPTIVMGHGGGGRLGAELIEHLFLSAGFVLEEGLGIDELGILAQTMGAAARRAGVEVVTGDTKVVDAGHGDGAYITTAGVGLIAPCVDLGPHRVRPGDVVLVSGPIGLHGIAVLSVRDGFEFG